MMLGKEGRIPLLPGHSIVLGPGQMRGRERGAVEAELDITVLVIHVSDIYRRIS